MRGGYENNMTYVRGWTAPQSFVTGLSRYRAEQHWAWRRATEAIHTASERRAAHTLRRQTDNTQV